MEYLTARLCEPLYRVAKRAPKPRGVSTDVVLGLAWEVVLGAAWSRAGDAPDDRADVLERDIGLLVNAAKWAVNWYRLLDEQGQVSIPAKARRKAIRKPEVAEVVTRWQAPIPWHELSRELPDNRAADMDADMDARALPETLACALDALEPRARLIVLMHGDGYSVRAIAAALGKTPKQARLLLERALADAAKLLEAVGVAPTR